ncbi:hypothetical protein N9X74_02415 [Porticoccaceae bacterium]|nr:hypothetical protein [Porticoccaceae bacterium]
MISLSKLNTYVFAIGTCAIFFNPMNFNNEIYPYFVLSYFLGRNNIFVFLIPLLVMPIMLIWFMIDKNPRVLIDGLAIAASLSALVKFSSYSPVQKQKICDLFITFLFINLIIIFLQFLYEPIQSLTYRFFSGREASLGLQALARNNAVTGLAGEPAYGSALLVGLLSIILTQSSQRRLLAILAVALSLLFLKSVTGIIFFILVVGYWFLFESSQVRRKRAAWITGIIFLIGISYIGYYAYQTEVLSRLIDFIVLLSDGKNIQEAEDDFGSARIGAVIYSFSNLIHLSYGTNYSLIGYLNVFLISPIIPVTLFFAVNRLGRGKFWRFLCGFLFASISGPILAWPLYWLLFKNLQSKTRLTAGADHFLYHKFNTRRGI